MTTFTPVFTLNKLALTLISSCFLLSALSAQGKTLKDNHTGQYWFGQGKATSEQAAPVINQKKAKNIILVVGDGMGITTHTAARIYVGQQQGLLGEEYSLSFENLPYSALIKTYNTNQQTPDSAGTMTALISGEKTKAGVVAISDKANRSDCASGQNNQLKTLFDLAESQHKATGIVTTARITHATPAALYAHSVERNWESDNQLSDEARHNNCRDIAQQLIDYNQTSQALEIILGGGKRHFLPEAEGGKRKDNQNLMQHWQQLNQHNVVTSLSELQQADLSRGHWLGLFSSSHIPYVDQRDQQTPGLLDMTKAALTRLQANPNGYALVVEAGRIDHGHHAGSGYKALKETEELHNTVQWLLDNIDLQETLLVVTADHSHTLTLAGYPTRGNPILGVVVSNDEQGYADTSPYKLNDGGFYTSMNYRNGPGAVNWQQHKARPSVDPQQALQPDYQQQALVPLDSETHGGEDVALYAAGPWAHLFGGTMEQHWVYHVMQHALNGEGE